MTNDNFKDGDDIFETTAKEIADRLTHRQVKKISLKAQPPIEPNGNMKLNKIVFSLFSINTITKITRTKD